MARFWLVPSAVAAAVSIAQAAGADVERSVVTKAGQTHVFEDDPLHSGVDVPGGGRIKVRPTPYRVMLIRPRASFVVELIETVEQIGP